MSIGETLRDERDEIAGKIEVLKTVQAGWRIGRETAITDSYHDLCGDRIDAIDDEIAALERELDDAARAVRQADPERPVWGRDGL